ncbi:hypothetical protein Q8A73_018135 [Channa argus]|nr:hypothetical protein Q8A73_018135 [Channa argus]
MADNHVFGVISCFDGHDLSIYKGRHLMQKGNCESVCMLRSMANEAIFAGENKKKGRERERRKKRGDELNITHLALNHRKVSGGEKRGERGGGEDERKEAERRAKRISKELVS